MRASERDRFKTAPQHRCDLITEGTRLSVSTIRRRLNEGNLNGRVARKKRLISDVNAQARLKYALSKRHCTADQWLKVMWFDESPFSLFPKCGKVYVRRLPGEEFQRQCLKPTVKHGGGSIMVWGCVSGAGMGKLKRLEGKVDAEVYYRILRHQMGPTMKLQGGRQSFVFMHDNASVHTAKYGVPLRTKIRTVIFQSKSTVFEVEVEYFEFEVEYFEFEVEYIKVEVQNI